MKAKDFDKIFDEDNDDILAHVDLSNAKRPDEVQKRVSVDFPIWMIQSLDKEARRLGTTRQAVIKFWIADKLSS